MAIESIGRMLIYIGIIFVLIGGFFVLTARLPWFGKLPGDFVLQRGGLNIFLPITTMVLVSLVLTLLLNLIGRR